MPAQAMNVQINTLSSLQLLSAKPPCSSAHPSHSSLAHSCCCRLRPGRAQAGQWHGPFPAAADPV